MAAALAEECAIPCYQAWFSGLALREREALETITSEHKTAMCRRLRLNWWWLPIGWLVSYVPLAFNRLLEAKPEAY